MNDLYTRLEGEELREDEGIYTVGDDIAESFYYGNFLQGVKQLEEINTSAKEFLEYLEQEADAFGIEVKDMFGGHFTNDFWIALGQSHY